MDLYHLVNLLNVVVCPLIRERNLDCGPINQRMAGSKKHTSLPSTISRLHLLCYAILYLLEEEYYIPGIALLNYGRRKYYAVLCDRAVSFDYSIVLYIVYHLHVLIQYHMLLSALRVRLLSFSYFYSIIYLYIS